MLITKYEHISTSIPKIGYDIILKLQERPYEPSQLYLELNRKISLPKFHDTLTFLYITKIIHIEVNQLRLVNEIE
jgi:hypothetical protein